MGDTVNKRNGIADDIGKAELREIIKKNLKAMNNTISLEQKKELGRVLIKIFERGEKPKDALNITQKELTVLYAKAHQLFNGGKYVEARELFKLLLTLDPDNAAIATSLGVCHHRLKDYELAAICYMMAAIVDRHDPLPHFYSYDCYMNLNEKQSARCVLLYAIACAGDDPKWAKLKDKAELLLAGLENKKESVKAS